MRFWQAIASFILPGAGQAIQQRWGEAGTLFIVWLLLFVLGFGFCVSWIVMLFLHVYAACEAFQNGST